ncbi:MAG: biopolymer transporter ExbD [Bryobacteraceae bacterium]|nr:biopolymer transporter ExbD [Bryobacteraceae bacterium]
MRKIKAPEVTSDINVIPLADVMLVMLIIFMVITPMLSKGVSVDMVMTDNPIAMSEADKEDAVLMAVTRDGKVYLGSTPITVEDVGPKVRDLLAGSLDKTIYLKSDARARYERVVEVVDNARSAGVDNIGLLTEKKKGRGSGGDL